MNTAFNQHLFYFIFHLTFFSMLNIFEVFFFRMVSIKRAFLFAVIPRLFQKEKYSVQRLRALLSLQSICFVCKPLSRCKRQSFYLKNKKFNFVINKYFYLEYINSRRSAEITIGVGERSIGGHKPRVNSG